MVLLLSLFVADLHAEVLDRIVAVVEAQDLMQKSVKPQIITQSEVNQVIRPILRKMKAAGGQFDASVIRKRALEELVIRALRDQKAKQLGVTVEQKDLDALMGQVERDNRLPFGALPQVLASQGISLAEYQLGLRNKLLQSRLIRRVIRPMVSVSDEEVRALFERVNSKKRVEKIRLSQILLKLEGNSSAIHVERIRYQAKQLVDKLRQGHSLEALAGQYSSDSSWLGGGDMGWFKRGELLPKLEKAVFDLQKGAVAGPIRSGQGFHVFKVTDKESLSRKIKEKSKLKVRHILIKVPESASKRDESMAYRKIQEIAEQVHQGAVFAELAKKYSEDATAEDGGDLGWFGEGVMVPAFDEVAFSLAIGETSEPVRTPFGWHLIRVDEKQFLDPSSYAAQRKDLMERVMAAKIQARYGQWLRDLRQRSFVEFRP